MAKGNKYGKYDEMRGKLGKTIVSKNRYGPIVYELAEYVDKKSSKQIKVRQHHKEVLALWQTLTPKEVLFINQQASQPEIRSKCSPATIVDGYSLFYYLKRNLQEIGEPINTKVDAHSFSVQHIFNNTVELNEFRKKQGLQLHLGAAIDENTKMIVYATHSLQGGLSKPKESWYRKIGVYDTRFKTGSYITADYLDVFEAIDMNKISIWFKFKTIDRRSGFASNRNINVYCLLIQEKS
jgi:hypothetical protein